MPKANSIFHALLLGAGMALLGMAFPFMASIES